ncbi:hypothetical protein ACP70R_028465 [Stipagrostis hirtigluma subsp. patula]
MSASGTALLRSMARKIARAPPPHHRLLPLRLHGRSPGQTSASRPFSSSANLGASPPPPTNSKVLLPHNKAVLSDWDIAKAAFSRFSTIWAYSMAFSSVIFIFGILKPKLEEVRAKLEAGSERRLKEIQEYQRLHIEIDNMLAKLSEIQIKQTSVDKVRSLMQTKLLKVFFALE